MGFDSRRKCHFANWEMRGALIGSRFDRAFGNRWRVIIIRLSKRNASIQPVVNFLLAHLTYLMLPVEWWTAGAGTSGVLSDPSIKHDWSSVEKSNNSDGIDLSVVVVVVVVVASFWPFLPERM